SVGRSTGFLLGEQGGGFLGGGAGVDLVLGGSLDHAGRRLLVLGSRTLLVEDRTRERRTLGKRQLDRIADQQPCVLRAGNGAFHEDQPASGVGAHDLEVL